jgi:peroxiredoxin
MRWITFCFLLINLHGTAQVVQNFSLTNVSTGQYVALADLSSHQGVAIIFTSTDCPYDNYYLSRIQNLNETYQSRIAILLINSNRDESMEQMKKFVEKHNLTMPYLWDLEQKAMPALGANKTPQCFLLDPSGGKFTIVYKGGIDDNAQSASGVNKPYLKDAMDQLLAKKKIEIRETRPVGCSIQ